MTRNILFWILGAILILFGTNALSQSLDGFYDASSRWGSGWIDLRQPMVLESGTCLQFTIGGTASRVIIRFLRVDDDPNRPVGIVGGIHHVPKSRELVVKLSRNFPNIRQVSIHGSSKAWHYDLGGTNGPATLEAVTIIPCDN